MLQLVEGSERMKSAEFNGLKVELTREGKQYRVTATAEGGYNKTRVFGTYLEASTYFDGYLPGPDGAA